MTTLLQLTPKEYKLGNRLYAAADEQSWPMFCRTVAEAGIEVCKALTTKFHKHLLKVSKTPGHYGVTSVDDPEYPNAFLCNRMIAAISACDGPVVQYVFHSELADALSSTPLPEDMVTIGDAFQLPYHVMSLLREGDDVSNYITLIRYSDAVLVITDLGLGTLLKLSTPLESLYAAFPESKSEVLYLVNLCLYITGGRDIESKETTEPLAPKMSAYKNGQRPQREMQFVQAVVGGKFTSALRRWERAQGAYEGEGAGLPPKPHCRAGHWHKHWFGPREGERTLKRLFHHPCLVNAAAIEEVEITRLVKSKAHTDLTPEEIAAATL